MAVKKRADETVVLGWVEWPDKATRDAFAAAMQTDPRWTEMSGGKMPFDGKRMIYGGFDVVFEAWRLWGRPRSADRRPQGLGRVARRPACRGKGADPRAGQAGCRPAPPAAPHGRGSLPLRDPGRPGAPVRPLRWQGSADRLPSQAAPGRSRPLLGLLNVRRQPAAFGPSSTRGTPR